MDHLLNLVKQAIHSGVTWKNMAGLVMFAFGIKSIIGAVTRGEISSIWILSADIRKSKFLFALNFIFLLAYTIICGLLGLGFGNTENDYRFL